MSTGDAAPGDDDFTVALATITSADIRVEAAVSIVNALTDPVASHARRWIVQPSGPYLDMGRNDAIRQYLAIPESERPDALLFVDSDIAFTNDDIHKLVVAARGTFAHTGTWPVIGGLYQGPHQGVRKVIAYRYLPDESLGGDRRFFPYLPEDLPEDDSLVLQVDGIGTGFMLIHGDTIAAFYAAFSEPRPWFFEGEYEGRWVGEDLYFCLRANHLEIPVLAHNGVRLVHYKSLGLGWAPELTEAATAPAETKET